MPPVARRHRGVEAEQRRSERRARLVGACLGLIGESGTASVTAEAVAARAGLTKRYFYESFADRDALLETLLGEFFTEVYSAMARALDGASPARRPWIIADTLVSELEKDRQRARLYIEAPGYPRLQQRREHAFAQFTGLLLANFPPEDAASGERRRFAALLLVAGTTQAVITWMRGELRLTRAGVIDELARVIASALPAPGRAIGSDAGPRP